jgi:hypothetical protein
MDPRTGKIDMGMLNTGTGQGQRKMRDDMRREVLSMLDGAEGGVSGPMRSSSWGARVVSRWIRRSLRKLLRRWRMRAG